MLSRFSALGLPPSPFSQKIEGALPQVKSKQTFTMMRVHTSADGPDVFIDDLDPEFQKNCELEIAWVEQNMESLVQESPPRLDFQWHVEEYNAGGKPRIVIKGWRNVRECPTLQGADMAQWKQEGNELAVQIGGHVLMHSDGRWEKLIGLLKRQQASSAATSTPRVGFETCARVSGASVAHIHSNSSRRVSAVGLLYSSFTGTSARKEKFQECCRKDDSVICWITGPGQGLTVSGRSLSASSTLVEGQRRERQAGEPAALHGMQGAPLGMPQDTFVKQLESDAGLEILHGCYTDMGTSVSILVPSGASTIEKHREHLALVQLSGLEGAAASTVIHSMQMPADAFSRDRFDDELIEQLGRFRGVNHSGDAIRHFQDEAGKADPETMNLFAEGGFDTVGGAHISRGQTRAGKADPETMNLFAEGPRG